MFKHLERNSTMNTQNDGRILKLVISICTWNLMAIQFVDGCYNWMIFSNLDHGKNGTGNHQRFIHFNLAGVSEFQVRKPLLEVGEYSPVNIRSGNFCHLPRLTGLAMSPMEFTSDRIWRIFPKYQPHPPSQTI